jgi:predicted nucleic acid-binding protein
LNHPAAFWDSSALNPLFANEPASPSARALSGQFSPVVWWATSVEINSAIARLHRTGRMDDRAKAAALDRFQAMRRDWYEVFPSDAVRDRAESLLHTYPLRAADSLQLAAALVWCRNRPKGRTFISADKRLCDAATHAGFTVLNP